MLVSEKQLRSLLLSLGVDTVNDWDTARLAQKVNQEGGIKRYVDPPEARPHDPELAELFDKLAADQEAGNLIEIVSDEQPVTPAFAAGESAANSVGTESAEGSVEAAGAAGDGSTATAVATAVATAPKKRGRKPGTKAAKPAKAKSAKPRKAPSENGHSNRYDGHKTFALWRKALAAKPKELPEEGVLAVTVDELKAAGKSKSPVTKDYLLKVLKKKFPDRDEKGMMTNINNNVPGRLLWMYGIHVWRQRKEGESMGYFIQGDGSKPQPKK